MRLHFGTLPCSLFARGLFYAGDSERTMLERTDSGLQCLAGSTAVAKNGQAYHFPALCIRGVEQCQEFAHVSFSEWSHHSAQRKTKHDLFLFFFVSCRAGAMPDLAAQLLQCGFRGGSGGLCRPFSHLRPFH